MPSIGLNLRVTTDSKQGGRLYMEDVLRVGFEKGLDGKEVEFGYFAVFDGHGGVEAAQFARDHLLNEIRKSKGFWSDDDEQVLKAIKLAFTNTHKLMWNAHMSWARTSSGYPSTSGTTSSVVVIRNQTLYVAHVGDSAVVLGTRAEDGRLLADCLTDEHKPNSPKEMHRIKESGGAVMAKAGVNRVVWQRPKKPLHGPIRRSTLVEKIPFLAVARSLGDLWSYNFQKDVFVVSPEPDILSIKLDPNRHKCLVIASDGLWNVIKPQQSVDFVDELERRSADYDGTKEKPASLLVKLALRRWDSLFYRADNTSVIVVMIDPPGPSVAKVNRTPSVSTGSTVRLASESDADDTSEDDITGSDTDIDLEEGETGDLEMTCEVDEDYYIPRINLGIGDTEEITSSLRGKGHKILYGRSATDINARGLSRPVPAGQQCFTKSRIQQGKIAKTCNRTKVPQKDTGGATSQQATQTSLKPTSTPNILMEAALNAPPFMDPATKVSPQMVRSPQKSSPLALTVAGSNVTNTDPATSPCRTLRSRSPRQVGENLTNSSGLTPVQVAPRSRFSLSPSSSFISNDLRSSPLEATSARSPLKVDTASRSGTLPLATVSPIWPSSLEVGSEVEVNQLMGVTRLASGGNTTTTTTTTTSGKGRCSTGDCPTSPAVADRSSLSDSGSENMEHPRRGRPACRQSQGVKRRASSSPASLSAKRAQTMLPHKTRTPQSQPNTRAHFKLPAKKAAKA